MRRSVARSELHECPLLSRIMHDWRFPLMSDLPVSPVNGEEVTDTERLDWMRESYGHFLFESRIGDEVNFGIRWTAFDRFGAYEEVTTVAPSFREAIDRAMRESEETRRTADFNRCGFAEARSLGNDPFPFVTRMERELDAGGDSFSETSNRSSTPGGTDGR